jgi:hypothetical protein
LGHESVFGTIEFFEVAKGTYVVMVGGPGELDRASKAISAPGL